MTTITDDANDTLDLCIDPPMPRDRTIGIGAVGAGFIMRDCHLVAYANSGFRLAGITSRTRSTAEEVAAARGVEYVYDSLEMMLDNPEIAIIDVAVPPDAQADVIARICADGRHVRGVLAQKPLGVNYQQAREIVQRCADAGIVLAVNQNMRFDQSIRACHSLLEQGILGAPVLATINMRAIPHWMPWQQRQGWLTLRIMSIHHLDTYRYLFGDPESIYVSARPDPRTAFAHEDGICLYILNYADGMRAAAWDDVWTGPAREGAASDIHIQWRVEGTAGMARGTIGWPDYPAGSPSTIDYTSIQLGDRWVQPRWEQRWFPDAFAGPMASLMIALEDGCEPAISGQDNLTTMALVDAGYRSLREQRAVSVDEIKADFA